MATLYQRGDNWYLNFRENGKQWRRSLGKIERRAAEKIKREKEAELTLGIRPVSYSPTLAEWIEDYVEWQAVEKGSKKRASELAHVKAKLGHHHIASLPARLVENFKIDRLRVAKPETVGKEIRILKAAMNRAVALGVIEKNPIAKISPPRGITSEAVEFYGEKELAALYKADPELGNVWKFLANTGLRRGEFVKARRRDIVKNAIRVESNEEGRTKSGKWREVPLNAGAREALNFLGSDRLSPFESGDTLTHKFARTAQAASVGGNLHKLRHTFCSHLAMAGVALITIKEYAGHSSIKMTEKYAHLAPEHKRSEIEKINL